jgi:hypothetical protein
MAVGLAVNGFFGDHSYTDEIRRGTPAGNRAKQTPMVHLITPHYQRKSFLRPRQPRNVWGVVRRYQLLELIAFTVAIVLVWLGAHLDNERNTWPGPEPAGVESASVDLIIGVPIGTGRPL